MRDASYDVYFAGELKAGTDLESARRRIQGLFNLPEQTIETLFSGHPIALKKGVNQATAARFREVFLQAGAIVQIIPSGPSGRADPQTPSAQPVPRGDEAAAEIRSALPQNGAPLRLAPVTELPLERQVTPTPPQVDISHLALIKDQHWTLADCAPQAPKIRMPDTHHLSLVEPELEQCESNSETD